MSLYQYYKVAEEDLLYRGHSSLERRILGKYVPRKIPQGFDSSRVKLIESSEELLSLIYCDTQLVSLRKKGKKKYWGLGKKESDTPAVYDVEFVVKTESEERLKKFEIKEGIGDDDILFSLASLKRYSSGIKNVKSDKVLQAAFGFVAKDVEHLMYEFEEGDDVDYLADCRMFLNIELPEEDGEEGMVTGNIEPVLELRKYMLDKFPLEMHSIAFK